MKSAQEWVNENSQSGPFDMLLSCKEAVELVGEIQKDTLASSAYLVAELVKLHENIKKYGTP